MILKATLENWQGRQIRTQAQDNSSAADHLRDLDESQAVQDGRLCCEPLGHLYCCSSWKNQQRLAQTCIRERDVKYPHKDYKTLRRGNVENYQIRGLPMKSQSPPIENSCNITLPRMIKRSLD